MLSAPFSAAALPPPVEPWAELAVSIATHCTGLGSIGGPPSGCVNGGSLEGGPVFVNFSMRITSDLVSGRGSETMRPESSIPGSWSCSVVDDVINMIYTMECSPFRPPAAGSWACQGTTVKTNVTGVNQIVIGEAECGGLARCAAVAACGDTVGPGRGEPNPFKCAADYSQALLAVDWAVDCYTN